MSAYSFTMHHLVSRLPPTLNASFMVSYKDDLYKLLLVQVMAAPTILLSADSAQGSFEDMIDIENASLHTRIRTMEAVERVTRNHERLARIRIEQQLASVQESHRQD
uniref:Uncharacterized protein n=1 Tax=Tanacetum cinerariifolium TaxID=118510 RepID=A0A699T8W7_TANCI|nr:hypothetical protein [Tanacetum cinerariifolium]